MNTEQITMNNEQRKAGFPDFVICSLLIALCSLLIACSDPIDSRSYDSPPLPPGMGSFSLTVSSPRTVFPQTPVLTDFNRLELIFTAEDGDAVSKTETINNYDGSSPLPAVVLYTGQYSLTVNAYKNAALAARGTLSPVVINKGSNTSGAVILKALLSQPGTSGTFSWNITVPNDVNTNSAKMTITPLDTNGTAKQDVNLFAGSSFTSTGSRTLNSGLYNVTFYFEKINVDGLVDKVLEWSELLHVYAALNSEFTQTFTDAHFSSSHYTVTFDYNNGAANGTQSVLHGGTLAAPATEWPLRAGLYPDPLPDNLTIEGWYRDGSNTKWNFANDVVTGNLTLYAKWSPIIDLSNQTTGANDVERAIAYVNANAGEYTLLVGANVNISSSQTLSNNANLTITSVPGGSYTITRGFADANGDGLFIVGNGAKLTFENIVIDGNKTVYTANEASLVCVNPGGTFTMETGAVLQNNRAGNGGGVLVKEDGTFTMKNGTISGNSTGGLGGGVYGPGTFIMEGGTISGNTSGDAGAGVNIETGGTFTMSGGEISKNITENVGGGVYVDGTFTMSGGNINENIADNGGGGIFVSSGTFTMTSGNVSGNSAADEGGGVWFGNGTFNMSGGTISNNKVSTGGGVFVSTGGKFNMSGSASVSGDNTATYGGGVFVAGTFTMDSGNISGNIASNEEDGGVGGGVHVGSGGTFTMNGGEVSGNTASESGGVVYVFGNDANFIMNGGKVNDNKDSGVFVSSNGNFTMTNGEVSGNTALDYGGGVVVGITGSFIMSGGEVSGNTAGTNGGGVYVVGSGNQIGTFTMTGGKVSDGNTANNGGGVYVNGGIFTMSGGTISGNTASGIDDEMGNPTGGGGGVFVSSSGKFTMQGNAEVSGNTADSSGGGGVYVESGTFTMEGSAVVSGNNANNGGGVYVTKSDVTGSSNGIFTMNGGTIGETNTAEYSGGGVYVSDGDFTMEDGEISGNTATGTSEVSGSGGGVYVQFGSFTMSGGTISGNNASGMFASGGGVYVYNEGTFTMSGTAIVLGNTAGEGGGVFVSGGTFSMNDSASVSGGNTATYGGGVFVSSGTFNMNNTASVSGNTASAGGGGVYVGNGFFNMSGGNVSGNTATNGGGVYVDEQGTFRISNGTVYGTNESTNSNTASGGTSAALYVDSEGTAQHGTFGSTWNDLPMNASDATSRDATIEVVNGELR